MCFTGDHDTVETFSPDRADQSLGVRILPWRSRRGRMIAYAHGAEALEEHPTVDGITIPDEASRRFHPRESLGQLSGDPLRGRIGGDIDPNEVASGDPDDDETVQQPETESRYNKEIDSSNVGSMVAQVRCAKSARADRDA
jgi:hypothetical protein